MHCAGRRFAFARQRQQRFAGHAVGGDAHRQRQHPCLRARVVRQARLHHFGIRDAHFLAGTEPETRGLEADFLHTAREVADHDLIAHGERFVERNRQCREQIAEDVLHRQRHRDARDAKAGDECGDIDAEIVERQHHHDHKHRDSNQHAHHRQRRAAAVMAIGCVAHLMQPEIHGGVGPPEQLEAERADGEHSEPGRQLAFGGLVDARHRNAHRHHVQSRRPAGEQEEKVVHPRLGRGSAFQTPDDKLAKRPEKRRRAAANRERLQPFEPGDSEQVAVAQREHIHPIPVGCR